MDLLFFEAIAVDVVVRDSYLDVVVVATSISLSSLTMLVDVACSNTDEKFMNRVLGVIVGVGGVTTTS